MGLSPPNRIQQPGKPIGVTEKKYMCPHTEHGLSPPLPLAHEPAAAAAATHVGRFSGDLRRRAARPLAPHGPRLPPLRPESPLPSSTARSQAHPPWLGFRVFRGETRGGIAGRCAAGCSGERWGADICGSGGGSMRTRTVWCAAGAERAGERDGCCAAVSCI
ncbi:hypothetical protein VPH35_137578 [Triticum aestivum]